MSTNWKPETYNSVSVYIMATGAQRVLDFLKQTFDAVPLRRYDNADGTIMHAEARVGDTVIMIADAGGPHPPFPSGSTSTSPM